ncbi:L,D-transpeptidase [Aestuariivirga litoralis]|uniref:L,D-transpeptidase n=1 Tax=Aestuariivirga litoralis TaxID=2650924 RepID=UPI001FEF2270|nr:L,D-transpeptidase [Aestuariivirga litoralis]
MNKLFKIAAAATLALSFASIAQAQDVKPFAGVVIVPASAPAEVQQPLVKLVKKPVVQQQATFKRAKIISYASDKAAGSIIVDTENNKLYYILGMDRAAMYNIASGKPGFEWAGVHKVSAKAEWPSWTPPAEMRVRRPELPAFMAGGPKNPLGARAMYLGSSIYRIHGTNEPKSIGKNASSGCIRMLNDDVTELYQFVKLGAEVTVM